MNVIYKNSSGTVIVKIHDNKFYYGNGGSLNVIGSSANQFLRFNPYMEKVEEKVPQKIYSWIEKNGN